MASELATRSPSFIDGKSQNAQEMRLHVLSSGGGATPLASRGGVRPSGGDPGLVAALPTPVMKVRVNAGIADVPSTSSSGGFYRVSWDQVDLDIDVSSAQARTDLVIVEVVDTGTSVATGKVRILKGTSGAGRPTNPVANAHWISLAATAVRVGAESAGNIRPQDVTPESKYAVAPGADIPVRNQAERDAFTPFWPLLTFKRLDTGAIERRNAANSGWETVYTPDDGTWTAYTPAWQASVAAPSLGNGTLTGRYRRLSAKTVMLRIFLNYGSTTNGGSGALSFSLPFASPNDGTFQALLVGGYTQDGKAWSGKADISPGASVCQPQLPKGPTPDLGAVAGSANGSAGSGVPLVAGQYSFVAGSSLSVTGIYEIA